MTKIINSLEIAKKPSDTRIVVAMSGGVDSSVVAAMLKHEGYDVIGITLQLYDHGAAIAKKGACCAGQDIADARRVAEAINIPHYVLNYENKFHEAVIEDFVDSYLAGQTPVPCIKCNQTVKFQDMLEAARNLGADAMATGHYVQRIVNRNTGKAELHAGADSSKDQSYFLFATTQEQLDFLRFPLGGQTKEETRKLAEKYNLQVSDKPDSQDICFVPEGGYAKLIEKMRPDAYKPGDIIHVDGTVLGQHKGIINYTIGQRKGLNIGHGKPLYVVRLDADKAQVIVGYREHLNNHKIIIKNINWLASDESAFRLSSDRELEVMIKWRSSQTPRKATIRLLEEQEKPKTTTIHPDDKAIVTLQQSQEAVAAGQACVIYDDKRVLGGGWII